MESLQTLKMLLGITDDTKDGILSFVLDKASDMICNYCRLNAVPDGLKNIMLSMAIDMYRAKSLGQEKEEGIVKSISEGDVSISFGSASSASENPAMVFLKDYSEQLNRYRKAGW